MFSREGPILADRKAAYPLGGLHRRGRHALRGTGGGTWPCCIRSAPSCRSSGSWARLGACASTDGSTRPSRSPRSYSPTLKETAGSGPGAEGRQGRGDGAGLFRRPAAPGHQAGRRLGRAGGGAPGERADRGGPGLRGGQQRGGLHPGLRPGRRDLRHLDPAGAGAGVFQVVATRGDVRLGGDDFDRAVAELLLERFREETGIDLRQDRLALQKIIQQAEAAEDSLERKPCGGCGDTLPGGQRPGALPPGDPVAAARSWRKGSPVSWRRPCGSPRGP